MTTLTEEEMDFLLVRQKDKILSLINHQKFREAQLCLDLVKELWFTHTYEYKFDELSNRIQKDLMSCRQITSQLAALQETNPVSKSDTPSTVK